MIPEMEGKKAVLKKSIDLDAENISNNMAYSESIIADLKNTVGIEIEEDTGYITNINEYNPDYSVIMQDVDGAYYINLTSKQKGIIIDTLTIYRKVEYVKEDALDDEGNPILEEDGVTHK